MATARHSTGNNALGDSVVGSFGTRIALSKAKPSSPATVRNGFYR